MATPFRTIITGNQQLDQIQQNVAAAFNSNLPSEIVTVDSNTFNVQVGTDFLLIPTSLIANGSIVTCLVPDAVANPGLSIFFKKTDTSSNYVKFVGTARNRQGNFQTIEGASSYSTNASLASGMLFSDGNNWWVVS